MNSQKDFQTDWDIAESFTKDDFEWVNKDGTSPGMCILGQGSYGKVQLCKNKKNKLLACKIIDKKKVVKTNMENYIKQEIEVHRKMKHPHILKLHGCCQDSQFVYILLDYCKNNSLYKHLTKQKKIKEKSAFTFFFQTALGIHDKD
jgi:serine/threonine protein kinase